MQEYDVKRGHAAKIDFRLIFEAAFESVEDDDEGFLCSSFGTMPRVRAKQVGKTKVIVDTETDKSYMERVAGGDAEAMAVAKETQTRWNDFLEGVTGFNAKERGKRAQKKAKEGKI